MVKTWFLCILLLPWTRFAAEDTGGQEYWFGRSRNGEWRAGWRTQQWQLDQLTPVPPHPHATTQGIEVGKARE